MDLSVIIVTRNNEKEIERCLRSVSAHEGVGLEVCVIDNASIDGTVGMLKKQIGITVIENDTNRGFAAAVNQGLARTTGDFTLLLNPDAAVAPGALAAMLAYLRAHPDVGVAGGKVLNDDGSLQPSVRRFPTAADQSVILLKLHRFFPRLIARYLADGFDYDRAQTVDQVRGAFFFISRRALDTVGTLDEKSFFIWFEEVDYCKRVEAAGLQVAYFPGSVCTHAGGASFAQALSIQKQRWLNRSMRAYFRKHGSLSSRLALGALMPLSLMLAAAAGIVPSRFKRYV